MECSPTEAEILNFLREVESGDVVLTALEEPQEIHNGNVDYTASNNWSLTVFNDANEWDYIDCIRTADGRECDFDTICNTMPQVSEYQPLGADGLESVRYSRLPQIPMQTVWTASEKEICLEIFYLSGLRSGGGLIATGIRFYASLAILP